MPTLRLTLYRSVLLSVLMLFCILALAPPAAFTQDFIFNGPRNYAVGLSVPWGASTVVADFNGDGRGDIAVSNSRSNDVSILLQNPDGTFQSAANYAVGKQPVFLQNGDFNSDGSPDLAFVNQADSTLGILLGNRDGTFQAPLVSSLPVSMPIWGFLFLVGDWNGDAKGDVAIAGGLPVVGTYGIAVMLGKGDGKYVATVRGALRRGRFERRRQSRHSGARVKRARCLSEYRECKLLHGIIC